MNEHQINAIKRLSDILHGMPGVEDYYITYNNNGGRHNGTRPPTLDVTILTPTQSPVFNDSCTKSIAFDLLWARNSTEHIQATLLSLFPRLDASNKRGKVEEEWQAMVNLAKLQTLGKVPISTETVLAINERLVAKGY